MLTPVPPILQGNGEVGMDVRQRIVAFRERQSAARMQDIPDTELGCLFREAIEKYPTAFWNCSPAFNDAGVDAVIDQLQKHGDLRAWYLAGDINEVRKNARRLPG